MKGVTFRKAAVWLSELWTGLGILLTLLDLVEKWPNLLHGAESLFYVLENGIYFIGLITIAGYGALFNGVVLGLIATAVSAKIFEEKSSIPTYLLGVGFLCGVGGTVFLLATDPAGIIVVHSLESRVFVDLVGVVTVAVALFGIIKLLAWNKK